MAVVVSLQDVVNEMEVISDEHVALINRKTGKLVTVTDEDRSLLERDEADGELADWEREGLQGVREIMESEDFIELPSKFDIHEWSIMERFCYSIENPDKRGELLNAIRGSGAFRYFKDTINRFDLSDEWYRFHKEALEEIAVSFLDSRGIAYTRKLRS